MGRPAAERLHLSVGRCNACRLPPNNVLSCNPPPAGPRHRGALTCHPPAVRRAAGGRGGGREKPKTAAELDKEMDDYFLKANPGLAKKVGDGGWWARVGRRLLGSRSGLWHKTSPGLAKKVGGWVGAGARLAQVGR